MVLLAEINWEAAGVILLAITIVGGFAVWILSLWVQIVTVRVDVANIKANQIKFEEDQKRQCENHLAAQKELGKDLYQLLNRMDKNIVAIATSTGVEIQRD